MADAGVRCLQVQDKAHDVLRNARAAVAVLDQRAADVSSVAEDGHSDSSTRLAGTVDVMTGNVDKIESCIEVRILLLLLSPLAIACWKAASCLWALPCGAHLLRGMHGLNAVVPSCL